MSNQPWLNDHRSYKSRMASKKAVIAVDKSKQVFCLECGSTTTKMELMAGESSFRRIGKNHYCPDCYGVIDRQVGS